MEADSGKLAWAMREKQPLAKLGDILSHLWEKQPLAKLGGTLSHLRENQPLTKSGDILSHLWEDGFVCLGQEDPWPATYSSSERVSDHSFLLSCVIKQSSEHAQYLFSFGVLRIELNSLRQFPYFISHLKRYPNLPCKFPTSKLPHWWCHCLILTNTGWDKGSLRGHTLKPLWQCGQSFFLASMGEVLWWS